MIGTAGPKYKDIKMAWIKVYSEIWDSWKIPTLCEMLKISEVQAVGHLISLWTFTERNAWRDGDLKKWGIIGISKAGRWTDKPEDFIAALQAAEFLNAKTHKVHQWDEHQAGMIHNRERHSAGKIPAERGENPEPDKSRVDKKREDKSTDCSEDKDIPKDIIKEEAEPVKRKETAEAYIVRQFKISLGVPELDKDWDKACFARNAKAAVAIIGAFQNDKVYATEWARKKIEHWQKWAKETGKSFSLERIAIEAQNDKGKYLEEKARIEKYQRQEGNNDKQHTTAKMGSDYTVGQIKDSGLTQIGKAITPNINKPKER